MDSWKCHHFLNYLFLEKVITDKSVIHKKTCQKLWGNWRPWNTNHSLWSKKSTHICLKETCEPTYTLCLHTQGTERQGESTQWTAALLLSTTLKSTSVPAASCIRGKQESSLQLPTQHFKQQSAKPKTVSSQKTHSDIFPSEPVSVLW